MTDPRKLRPSELCHLLNSTPLGEVIKPGQLRRHRTQAGLRIGDNRHVDLLRYAAWQVHLRHKTNPDRAPRAFTELWEVAQGAAAVGSRWEQMRGHGQKFTRKQEVLIAALLTEPTCEAAAQKAGVAPSTLYRWLQLPVFRAAYDRARQEPLKSTISHLQLGTRPASEVLLHIALHGKRESDRIRAASIILDLAMRGHPDASMPSGEQQTEEVASMKTTEVVRILATRLRQIDAAQLPTAEKARLTAMLSDAFLRAISMDELNKRMEALEGVLLSRKGQRR